MKKAFGSLLLIMLALHFTFDIFGSDASRIEKVLRQCAQFSAQVRGLDPAVQARIFADKSQALDVSRCPMDFRVAFQEHVNAWRNAQSAIANNTLAANILEGVVAGLRDDPSGIGSLQTQTAIANEQISATYYQLTVIAARYGAPIPRSVVE